MKNTIIIPSIEQTKFLQSWEEAINRQEQIFSLFEEECKLIKSEYNPNLVNSFNQNIVGPKINFVISHNNDIKSIWIVGNKRAGSEHDRNEWKKTPVFLCEPIKLHGNDHMLDLHLNYGEFKDSNGPTNIPDWKCDHIELRRKIKLVLKNAVYHFIETPKNTI